MDSILGSPALKRLIADVEEHLNALRVGAQKGADVVAEIDAVQRVLTMLGSTQSGAQLIAAYDAARDLLTPERFIEAPSTDGKNRAGVWLKPRIEVALDALGIGHSSDPAPSASPQPKAPG